MVTNQEEMRIRRKIKAWMSDVEPPVDGWSQIEDHFKKQALESTINRRMGMFSMNPYILEQFWRERQKELLHDVEQYRLVKLALESQGRQAGIYDKVLATLGNLLVNWGVRLQDRRRGTIEYSKPIIRRSTNDCQNMARCYSGFKGGGIF